MQIWTLSCTKHTEERTDLAVSLLCLKHRGKAGDRGDTGSHGTADWEWVWSHCPPIAALGMQMSL